MIVVFNNRPLNDYGWSIFAKYGNFLEKVYMSPNHKCTFGNIIVQPRTFVIVLSNISPAELNQLTHELLFELRFVVDIQDDFLDNLRKGSDVRMKDYLLGESFVLPPKNQLHLVVPLCRHAGVDPNELPGVVSVENAKLAVQYAVGWVAWAVLALVQSKPQRV